MLKSYRKKRSMVSQAVDDLPRCQYDYYCDTYRAILTKIVKIINGCIQMAVYVEVFAVVAVQITGAKCVRRSLRDAFKR